MAGKKKKKKKNQAGSQKAPQGGGFPVVPILVTLLVIVVGVGAGFLIWSRTSDDEGGLKLETGIDLPSWVTSTAPRTVKAYQVALTIPDDLKQIPCYCGCSADGHTSNLDCFIQKREGDNVIFDDHGAG